MVGIKIGDKLIISIPLQFDVIARNHRVITDGFTNYSGPNPHADPGDIASTMSIPDELIALMKQQQTEAMGLLGSVIPETAWDKHFRLFPEIPWDERFDYHEFDDDDHMIGTMQTYDPQTNEWVDPPEETSLQSLMDESSEALSGSVGSMQGLISKCTELADYINETALLLLGAVAGGADFATAQAAMAAHPHPMPEPPASADALFEVEQAAQQLQKFSDIAKGIKGSTGEVGNVVSQITDIAKNATMLAAMGSLSEGIAKAAGMPAPPSMNVAFESLTTGHVGNAMHIMNAGMSVVNGIASKEVYEGQLDDINDLVWQGGFGESGFELPFAGITVPLPTWENTIPCGIDPETGLPNFIGQFPLGGSIGSMMEMAKERMLGKLAECNSAITAAMQPLTELGAAAAMIQQLGSLPDALRRNLSDEMMNLATQAFNNMYPGISLTVPPMPEPLTNINCDPAEIFETAHGGSHSGTGGSVLDFAANIGSTIMSAGHGTVWKPVSEKDGNLAVLLPRKFGQATVTVGGDVGVFAGFTNGNRGTYRFPKPGAGYGPSTSVSIAGTTTKIVTVPDPGIRKG
tara:strand:- start:3597 stop:5321 length:1725 start_codon:yes stop_codon:yes gene_type:complete